MIDDADFRLLAAVRYELRHFAKFTEMNTTKVGLTPQQHQVLLALRASEKGHLTIGELAETMLLAPHSISSMGDQLEKLGLVERVRSGLDRRRTHLIADR